VAKDLKHAPQYPEILHHAQDDSLLIPATMPEVVQRLNPF
jgi:hypothetical protein